MVRMSGYALVLGSLVVVGCAQSEQSKLDNCIDAYLQKSTIPAMRVKALELKKKNLVFISTGNCQKIDEYDYCMVQYKIDDVDGEIYCPW